MNRLRLNNLGAGVLLVLLVALGCNQSVQPLEPLAVEQLPSALEKAFSKAQPAVKDVATQVVAALQAQDYAKASEGLRNLMATPGLTKEQVNIASRGSLTAGKLLGDAAAKGDENAAATLKYQLKTK